MIAGTIRDDRAASGAPGRLRVFAVDHTGGIAPFRKKFAAIAAQGDIDLSVLVPRHWVENFAGVNLDVEEGTRPEGYRLRSGSVFWPGYENRGFFTRGLPKAIRDERPEILHLWEEPFSLFALQTLCLRPALAPRAKVIFSSSDNLTRDGRYPYRPSWFYRRVEQFAFRTCAAGIAVSQEVEEVLRIKGYRGPVDVVPHGVDLADYPERVPDERSFAAEHGLTPPVVGYVGRLLRQKGVDTLLRAFAALRPEPGPAPSLVIVGDGPDREAFLREAEQSGIAGRTRFLPGVPHGEVARIYRSIDVLVVPSRTTPKWKEQFGRVLIEGMAAGCVVIGSSSGAIPHVVGDAGLIVPEGDAPALAAAIGRVLREPGLAAGLRAKARERVRLHYTWDAVAAKLVRLYRSVGRAA